MFMNSSFYEKSDRNVTLHATFLKIVSKKYSKVVIKLSPLLQLHK